MVFDPLFFLQKTKERLPDGCADEADAPDFI